jgi:hypothetical protein
LNSKMLVLISKHISKKLYKNNIFFFFNSNNILNDSLLRTLVCPPVRLHYSASH